MSTQSTEPIPFTHTTRQQGLRLLELPQELVDLVTSTDAPTLELKSPLRQSQSESAAEGEESDAREYVNLCTPTQTYRLQQVQSSNSLHVLRPSRHDARANMNTVAEDDDNDGMDMALTETDAMTSVAKCGSTLELHSPAGGFSATPFLVRLVGIYGSGSTSASSPDADADTDMDMGDDANNSSNHKAVIDALFANIPVSRAQCETAFVEHCIFVHKNKPWRPLPRTKVDVWRRVIEGAVLQGISLDQQFLVNDLWKSVLDEEGEEPFPRGLFEAVVRRVCECDCILLDGMKWTSIDKTRCIQWIGETYLEAMAPAALGRSVFLSAWKDHLPESWGKEVAFSKLPEGCYKFSDPATISFVNEVDRHKLKKNLSTDASAATTAKRSRNWHELFKNQRRR